ncbi:MAG: hypothetical protein ACFFCW_14180 [Candidatus Hodarchaeota archaeon]
MNLELGRREYWVIAAIFFTLFGCLFPIGSSYRSEDSILRELTIKKGQSVSTQSLREGPSPSTKFGFPPPLYIFESIEFEVDVFIYNDTGSTLELNFTRDDTILRTEMLWGSAKILLSGYGKYRFRRSNFDVTLRAIDKEIRVKVLINIGRHTRLYNPLAVAFVLTAFWGVIVLEIGSKILTLYKKRT